MAKLKKDVRLVLVPEEKEVLTNACNLLEMLCDMTKKESIHTEVSDAFLTMCVLLKHVDVEDY